MSRQPAAGARPSNSLIFSPIRFASGTPRRRIPTSTRSSTPLFRSTISCAMRVMIRRRPSASTISAFSRSDMRLLQGTVGQLRETGGHHIRQREGAASAWKLAESRSEKGTIAFGTPARGPPRPEHCWTTVITGVRRAHPAECHAGGRRRVRHLLPRLVLCILALAPTASAQIAMPEGVALSPFPVLQSPVEYTTFDDGGGGIWAVFLGAQSGSGLYVQHIRADGSFENDFSAAARWYAKSGTLVNNISSAPDGIGGVVVNWFGVNAKDSTSQYLALRFTHILNDGSIPGTTIPDTGIVVSTIASAAMVIGDGQGGAYVVWEELKGPSNPDLYAQHYDYWGHPMWTPLGSPTGIPVCAVVGLQRLRAIH